MITSLKAISASWAVIFRADNEDESWRLRYGIIQDLILLIIFKYLLTFFKSKSVIDQKGSGTKTQLKINIIHCCAFNHVLNSADIFLRTVFLHNTVFVLLA